MWVAEREGGNEDERDQRAGHPWQDLRPHARAPPPQWTSIPRRSLTVPKAQVNDFCASRAQNRLTLRRDVYTTAVASISTFASASTSAVTWTTAIAGKWRPITSRYAAPISFRLGQIGVAIGDEPGHPHDMLGARVRPRRARRRCCAASGRTCPARSARGNAPVSSQPIWPPTNTSRPDASIPFAYPRGSGQPGGCRRLTRPGLAARCAAPCPSACAAARRGT